MTCVRHPPKMLLLSGCAIDVRRGCRMGRVTAVACFKGGTGKTTTALNLATFLADAGQRVLVVDLDSSAGASLAVGALSVDNEPPVLGALREPQQLDDTFLQTSWGFDLMASGPGLLALDEWIRSQPGGEYALAELLAEPGFAAYDVILLDCPGAMGHATTLALVAADDVMIPLDCKSDGSFSDLMQLWSYLGTVKKRMNANIAVSAIVPCRTDRTKLSQHLVRELLKHEVFGGFVLRDVQGPIAIRENVSVADAKFEREPLSRYAPSSSGANDYGRLTAAYLEQQR